MRLGSSNVFPLASVASSRTSHFHYPGDSSLGFAVDGKLAEFQLTLPDPIRCINSMPAMVIERSESAADD
jgi:hypothetical protein